MNSLPAITQGKTAWTRRVATVMPVAIFAILAMILSSPSSAIAQTVLPAPTNIVVVNGPNSGDVVVSWDPVEGANFYRIGWLSITDFLAAGDDWREQFRFSEVEDKTTYNISRLVAGDTYLFIVGSNTTRYGSLAWPEDMVSLTISGAVDEPLVDCVAEGTCLPILELGTFAGTGDSLQHVFALEAGIYRFTTSRSNTDRNLFIDVIELASGEDQSVGIYGRGESGGQEALTIYDDNSRFRLQAGNYLLDVDADHDWAVTVEQIIAH